MRVARYTLTDLILGLGLALALLWVLAGTARAATYYVDPVGGSDDNPGTSRQLAWAGMPSAGADGSGWKKLLPGDRVYLKRGAVFTEPLHIKSDWYSTSASDAVPIRLGPDPDWGSGPVTWRGAGILIQAVDGIHLDGLSRAGIVIEATPGRGLEAIGTSPSKRLHGLGLSDIRVVRAGGRHVALQMVDGFLLQRVDVDGGNGSGGISGICLGEDGDRGCSNGRLLECTAAAMGPKDQRQGSGTNNYQGFWIVNCRDIYLDGCDAFDNSGRGFDTGGVGSAGVAMSDQVTFYRCRSFGNRNDGFGSSAEDFPESQPSRHNYNYCLSYRNGGGGWQIYEGVTANLYNCVSDLNGTALRLWGVNPGMNFRQGRQSHIKVYNCVLSRPTATSGDDYTGTVMIGYVNALDLKMDYNLYVQGTSPYAVAWGYFNPGPDVRYRYNATEAPGGRRKWFTDHGCDEHSLCSSDGKQAGFMGGDRGDYRLAAGSACLDAGTSLGLTQDFDRNSVPQNGRVDIGSFERLVAATSAPTSPKGLRAVPE